MYKKINLIVISYFSLALALAPIHLFDFDTYYYWDWSRHLALSYYDGSPMIAYIIKAATMMFGDTLFAFNWISITATALTAWVIYLTARLFLTKESSYVAMLLWLFSPTIALVILNAATYDIPLMLFWVLTIYYSMKYIKFEQRIDLYAIALSCGLMLLSKYSGIVLILAIFIFLITTSYRSLLKSHHLYLALLIMLLIFSPVMIWNYQHHWLSFLYQLTSHQLPVEQFGFRGLIEFLWTSKRLLPTLNFLLLLPIICWVKKYYKSSPYVYFNFVVCVTFLGFYLFSSLRSEIRYNWLASYIVSSVYLAGFCYQQGLFRRFIRFLIIVYAIISVSILLVDSFYPNNPIKKFGYYHLIQKFNEDYPKLPPTILTSGWSAARLLYFLNNKPYIYTLGCGEEENQYIFWSADVKQKIADKTIKSALYLDTQEPPMTCLHHYFSQCRKLATRSYFNGSEEYKLFAYDCSL